jgi:hypothetical protein
MEMPAAFVTAINSVEFEFNSARPNAPVVPHVEKPQRSRAVRRSLAKVLTRAVRVVKLASTAV